MKPRTAIAVVTALLFVGMALVLNISKDERGSVSRLMLDASYYHCYLESLFLDGDLDFHDEYRETGNYENLERVPETGLYSNVFGIGPPLFSAPLYGLGKLIDAIGGGVERKPYDNFGGMGVKVTLLASPLLTALTLVFMVRLIRRRMGGLWLPLYAGVTVILAGPAFYYASRQAGNSHPAAMFFTAWLIDFWDASYERPRTMRTWLALGALFGATVLARPQLVLWGIVPLLAAIDDARRIGWRVAWPRWLAALGLTCLIFTPQLLAWREVYGHYFVVPQGPGFMVWTSPRWSEVLFSSRNGLFAWSPIFAVGTVGLFGALRGWPRLVGVMLAGFAGQIIANGAVWDWWGGPSYGGRRFDSCFVIFAFGLAWLLLSRWRLLAGLVGTLAAFCIGANVRFAVVTGVWGLMPPGGAPLREVLRQDVAWFLAIPTAALSEVATFPARVAFSLQTGAPLEAYDRVVGSHFVTEVYPGLGGYPRPEQRVQLHGDEPFLLGFKTGRWAATMAGDHARILVPLNKRTGPIKLQLRIPARNVTLAVRWDGRELPVVRPNAWEPEVLLDPIERGVHTLDLTAPAGTDIHELVFSIPPGTPP